jgi:hypothetical protein
MQSFFSSSVAFKQNYITIFWRNFELKSEVDCRLLNARGGVIRVACGWMMGRNRLRSIAGDIHQLFAAAEGENALG